MPFEPKNALEHSLVKATTDPAHRPQFFRDFIAADIFVIQHGRHLPSSGQFAMKPGDQIELGKLQYGDKQYIPIFSSLEALNLVVTNNVNYLRLNAGKFLEMTRGNLLLLNPGTEYLKEFTEHEVEQILDGTLLQPG